MIDELTRNVGQAVRMSDNHPQGKGISQGTEVALKGWVSVRALRTAGQSEN